MEKCEISHFGGMRRAARMSRYLRMYWTFCSFLTHWLWTSLWCISMDYVSYN